MPRQHQVTDIRHLIPIKSKSHCRFDLPSLWVTGKRKQRRHPVWWRRRGWRRKFERKIKAQHYTRISILESDLCRAFRRLCFFWILLAHCSRSASLFSASSAAVSSRFSLTHCCSSKPLCSCVSSQTSIGSTSQSVNRKCTEICF